MPAGLYPYPPLYRGIDSCQLEAYAKSFSEKITKLDVDNKFFTLYKKTIEGTDKDSNHKYSPIRLAAGVEFENNIIEVVWQDKLIEYGTTTDPVAKLIVFLQKYGAQSIKPRCIVQVDQYGVMHAPFASGRSNLYENGYKDLSIIIHDNEGNIKYTNPFELSPEKFQ